jgi:hypothetical protein
MYTEYQILSILAGVYLASDEVHASIIVGRPRNSLCKKIIINLKAYNLTDEYIHSRVYEIIKLAGRERELRV